MNPLRIGFIGSGFIARFHLQSFLGVRDAQIAAVYSPTAAHREVLAGQANDLELGPCRPFASIEEMIRSGEVDAVWLLGTNAARLETMRAIHDAMKGGGSSVRAVACAKRGRC